MKAPAIPPGPPGASGDERETEGTGLPGFKTWPAVYVFVMVTFVVWVVLLEALMRAFS
jgi:hypothetical protein